MALFHLGKLNLAAGHDMLRSAATMFRELGDTASEHAALDLLPVDPQWMMCRKNRHNGK